MRGQPWPDRRLSTRRMGKLLLPVLLQLLLQLLLRQRLQLLLQLLLRQRLRQMPSRQPLQPPPLLPLLPLMWTMLPLMVRSPWWRTSLVSAGEQASVSSSLCGNRLTKRWRIHGK